jgi:aminoglycoside phosphotransferase (APT) family kinase protein
MTEMDFSAMAASARAIAEANALQIQSVAFIGGYANAIFKLEPLPLVARIATASQTVRQNSDWLRREIAVGQYLEHVGGRAIRPSKLLPCGPYAQDNYQISFWDYAHILRQPATPVDLGRELQVLHRSLAKFPSVLPKMEALNETWRILEHADFGLKLPSGITDIISRKTERLRDILSKWPIEWRPLHGDAHYGNLWNTADGLIWGDFEDVHSGPVEWDIACMVTSSHVFGNGRASKYALEAYDCGFDSALLDLLIEGRTLQAIAWALVSLPDPIGNPRFQKRLGWLA